MTTCPISIFAVDMGSVRIGVYLIVSSPYIFCHDINNHVLYSGIERQWVVIFFISKLLVVLLSYCGGSIIAECNSVIINPRELYAEVVQPNETNSNNHDI